MPRAGHEVHREKPFGEVRPRFVEDRASGRVNVVATVLANEGPTLGEGMKLGLDATAGADDFGSAVIYFHELGEAGRIIRVHDLKCLESMGSGLHRIIPLPAIAG